MVSFFIQVIKKFYGWALLGAVLHALLALSLVALVAVTTGNGDEYIPLISSMTHSVLEFEETTLLLVVLSIYVCVQFSRFIFISRVNYIARENPSLIHSVDIADKKRGYLIFKTLNAFPSIGIVVGLTFASFLTEFYLWTISLMAFFVFVSWYVNLQIRRSHVNWSGMFAWGRFLVREPSVVFFNYFCIFLFEVVFVLAVLSVMDALFSNTVDALLFVGLIRYLVSNYARLVRVVVIYAWTTVSIGSNRLGEDPDF